MSETGTDTEVSLPPTIDPNDPFSDEYHFGSGIFALPISSELRQFAATESTKLTEFEARKIIARRFDAYTTSGISENVMKRIAEMIAKELPEEDRTDRVIESMDLRPYLQVAISDGRMVNIGAEGGTYTQQALAEVLAGFNASAKTVAEQAAVAEGRTGANAQAVINASQEIDTTAVGIETAARYAQAVALETSGQIRPGTAGATVFNVGGDTNMYDEQLDKPVWSEDDVIAATMLPTTFLDTAIAYEADFNEAAGTPGVVRGGIILETAPPAERIPPDRNDRRRWPAPQPRSENKMLSYGQAASYLNNLTDAEYTDWQSKLATAGYYDQIGSQYVAGDRDDQATAKAWDELLKDAWTGKKGIDVTLVEKAKTAREVKAQRTMARWGTTETSRDAIEAAAMEILGRQLSAEEFGFVRDSISSLQQERSDDLVGVDSMNWYNEETAAQGFDAADVNDRIMREFGGELAVQNAMDVRQKLRDRFDYQADPVVIPGDDYTVPVTPFEPSMVGSAATPRFPTGRAAVPRFPTGRAAVPRFPTGVAAADGAIEGAG
jgi:hypothetical protein